MIFCYKLGGACEEQIDVNFALHAAQKTIYEEKCYCGYLYKWSSREYIH